MLSLFAIVAFLVASPVFTTPTSSAALSAQLGRVIDDHSVPESHERNQVRQALSKYRSSIDQYTASIRTSNQTQQARAIGACHIGQILFGRGEYLDTSSEGYANATEVNWSTTSWLKPQCIFQPFTAAGVAVLLKTISYFQCKFATRSGGHNANSGFGSIDGSGVLLDLSKLRHLDISQDHETISIGPGNRWGDVYEFLDPYSLSAIGTKEPSPGVGGSILGGGDPFFPSMYGLACDNVADFEVVLSNSSIIHANTHQNSDLFIALRGGGPNFGIVTTYTMYTVPIHETWYEVVVYSNTSNTELLQALVKYQQITEDDPKANMIFTFAGGITVVGFLYAQHKAAKPAIFASFDGIPIISTLIPSTNGTISQLSNAIGSLDSPITAKRSIFGLSTGVSDSLYNDAYTDYLQASNLLPSTGSLILSFQPTTLASVKASNAHGTNSLGVANQAQNWFAVVVQWTSDADAVASQNTATSFYSMLSASAQTHQMLLDFVYQNDAGYFQKPLATIGATNLARLKTVSKEYDESQMFQMQQNNGFLLSKT